MSRELAIGRLIAVAGFVAFSAAGAWAAYALASLLLG